MQRLTRETLREACDFLAARHDAFSRLIDEFGYPPLWARRPGFGTLTKIILEQQVSLQSAAAIYSRLKAAAGAVAPREVAALGVDGLRGAGLTRQKARYCHTLALRVLDGSTNFRRIHRLSENAAREMLMQVPGVGPWSADVYLLFAMRLPDIWPPRDLALIRSASESFTSGESLDHDACHRLARGWSPRRSAAARVLWHAYLRRRGREFPGSG